MATLYGSGRVLKDALPQNNWKTEVWKDGIGNIDEEHNGIRGFQVRILLFHTPNYVNAKHTIQQHGLLEKNTFRYPSRFHQ